MNIILWCSVSFYSSRASLNNLHATEKRLVVKISRHCTRLSVNMGRRKTGLSSFYNSLYCTEIRNLGLPLTLHQCYSVFDGTEWNFRRGRESFMLAGHNLLDRSGHSAWQTCLLVHSSIDWNERRGTQWQASRLSILQIPSRVHMGDGYGTFL